MVEYKIFLATFNIPPRWTIISKGKYLVFFLFLDFSVFLAYCSVAKKKKKVVIQVWVKIQRSAVPGGFQILLCFIRAVKSCVFFRASLSQETLFKGITEYHSNFSKKASHNAFYYPKVKLLIILHILAKIINQFSVVYIYCPFSYENESQTLNFNLIKQ